MLLETFHGNDLRSVFDDARRALGEDVLVIRSQVHREGSRTRVEVVAAPADRIHALVARLEPPAPAYPRTRGRTKGGPLLVAVVGPTGAGKTTTAAKLALHPQVFGGRRTGLVTLDTYRVGALEQIQQYAEVTNLPLDIIYDAREVPAAIKRLEGCEVIVIDTPGRSPRAHDANAQWQSLLRAIAPDEVHLVLPATMRPDAVPAYAQSLTTCRPTHVILSKVDELADERAVSDVAARVDLPMRWLADGQSVPADLHPARERILSALGLTKVVLAGRTAA
jgi:flagellar biosynthesis protein FlhF